MKKTYAIVGILGALAWAGTVMARAKALGSGDT